MTWKLSLLPLCFALECAACQTHLPRPSEHGEDVARQLNLRNDDTRMACPDNRAAYYCNGVLIRATDAVPTESDPRHAWDFSNGSGTPEGLSFSYLRKDVDSRILYGPNARPHGLILKQADAFATAPGKEPVDVLCSFPYDAVTGSRATTGDPGKGSNGCGANPSYLEQSMPCASQGIDAVDSWRKHFNEVTAFPTQFYHQCGFGADQPSFALSIAARLPTGSVIETMRHMEQMVGNWRTEFPAELPIEAVFYTAGPYEVKGLEGARLIQRDYNLVTGKVIPIVRFTTDMGVDPFSYREADQAIVR